VLRAKAGLEYLDRPPTERLRFAILAQDQKQSGKRSIEIDEKALGTDHPYVGMGYNNLAVLLKHQGNYAEAEPLYRRAIEISMIGFMESVV
jgi:tetratricopeptide (TPR) repeat protein